MLSQRSWVQTYCCISLRTYVAVTLITVIPYRIGKKLTWASESCRSEARSDLSAPTMYCCSSKTLSSRCSCLLVNIVRTLLDFWCTEEFNLHVSIWRETSRESTSEKCDRRVIVNVVFRYFYWCCMHVTWLWMWHIFTRWSKYFTWE